MYDQPPPSTLVALSSRYDEGGKVVDNAAFASSTSTVGWQRWNAIVQPTGDAIQNPCVRTAPALAHRRASCVGRGGRVLWPGDFDLGGAGRAQPC